MAQKKKFKPLRMTIMGCGGTGKSVLINTLVTCIRKIFDDNDSVFVTAPTGAAAYNVGGSTIHREFKINVRDVPGYNTLSDNTKKKLMKKLLRTIALFFDERSMIGLMLLGQTELNIKETVHNGGHDTEDWGGIPVVAIFGDDYQLPPPVYPGAFVSFEQKNKNKTVQNGCQQFISLGETTMELTEIMRQNEDETEFRSLLDNTRLGYPTESDKDVLLSLHLNSGNLTPRQIEYIRNRATFLYANKQDVIEHNWSKIKEIHSSTNPVPRIQNQTTSKNITYNGKTKCMKKECDIDSVLNCCREARVQLTGKNFEPDWGLFNGTQGTIKEIVYKDNESPLEYNFPLYIIVDFPTYCGPSWIKNKPTWVPIPPIEITCKKHCCTYKYIPLSIAYARTGHTFQGQNVGPNHPIPCIVVNPGKKSMELLCPGLLYMFISRATTIGTPQNRFKSALFFCSNNMNKARISNITQTKNGTETEKIKKRRKWIKYLQQHAYKIKISTNKKQNLIKWVEKTKIPQSQIDKIIIDDIWRKSNMINY